MSVEFFPIHSLSDLNLQNEEEMVAGYMSGLNNEPCPGSHKSRSFWHGWRNGMADAGQIPIDKAMRQLAEEFVRKQKAH